MRFQRLPRPRSVLASTLAAAGLMVTLASCSHITPLGPDPAATLPVPHQLRAPFVLEAMRVQSPTTAGGCPAGYVALSGDNPVIVLQDGSHVADLCYRKIGTPVAFTSAAVSSVSNAPSPKPPLGPAAPAQSGFTITLSAAEVPALTAVTTTAYQAHGALAVSVAGRTWALPFVAGPFTGPQLQIQLPRNQALQLHNLLVPSG